MTYEQLLQSKQKRITASGFDCDLSSTALFDFQKFIVQRALKAGKYAIFADCGMGKTIMQLVWANEVNNYTGGKTLILAPLAVVAQTIQEAKHFSIPLDNIDVANYEQLENIDCNIYNAIVLDESSILKNFEGAYRNLIIDTFKDTPYKLACTATPSPNDPMELGNHAEFLNIMSRNEMLAMYFVHDGGETSKWRIKGHAEKDFWRFVSSWAIMVSKPSDIGFSDEGYILPGLNFIEHQIITKDRANGGYLNTVAVSATNFNAELRITKIERLDHVQQIVNNSDESFLIWVKQNEEGEELRRMLPWSVEVKGNDDNEFKKQTLLGFAENKFRVLITKSKIAGYGMNFQNCHNQIFPSLDFSFESLYQALRRSYRFGQLHPVNIYLITTDTMQNVIESIKRKQKQFESMQQSMQLHMNEVFNETSYTQLETQTVKTDKYELRRGDSFLMINDIGSNTIDCSFFSPPFSSLYVYSDNVSDLSNCINHDEFYSQFEFMVPELLRITKPGRMVGMHITQLTTGISKDGYFSVIDFRGEIIRLFQRGGFIFHGEVTIWKNPELAAVRTKNHQLLHKTTKRDSTICRPGLADYLIIMRKPGVNNNPVNHEGSGIDFEKWCKIASPVWMDIRESDTLQFRTARENNDERHITPTQLSIIENFLTLYSNKNDLLFSPFMGIGSEIYQAVKMGRRAVGFELKQSYFDLACKNVADAAMYAEQKTFFDL